MKRPELHMPACLMEVKSPTIKRESTSSMKARKVINAKLEEIARDLERLGRDIPEWRSALSSASERIRSKKVEIGEL